MSHPSPTPSARVPPADRSDERLWSARPQFPDIVKALLEEPHVAKPTPGRTRASLHRRFRLGLGRSLFGFDRPRSHQTSRPSVEFMRNQQAMRLG